LAEILQSDRVSENEALTQLDRVLAVEREMKKAQLAMLIRIKNLLTPEQQGMVKRLR
jgi:Spy/CpxP family protein refolding chaperone